nr:MAG TPA: hypothetical protein [Caudoviricetes sp.]
MRLFQGISASFEFSALPVVSHTTSKRIILAPQASIIRRPQGFCY